MAIVFAVTFFLIVFHYFFFAPLIIVLAKLFPKKHLVDSEHLPSVTFIVAAYNEERVIEQKILNDLNMDYPKDKLQYIVVSDGSSDSTPRIVEGYADKGITSLHENERKGKIAALNRAITYAKNDVLVFSDANSFFQKDAIRKLVRHLKDDSIGGVCGRKAILQNEERKASLGDSLYWEYESRLKGAESKLSSIPTADGEIFAMKRELYRPVESFVINDDTAITLNIISQGKRVIYDHEAVTLEEASITLEDDFNVKSRMVCGGIQMLTLYPKELGPFSGWFGLQFFCHKTLRYFMWLLLILIFVSNVFLVSDSAFYFIFLSLQLAFYALALVGSLLDRAGRSVPTLLYIPYYYCNVNIASFKGFLFFLKQRSIVDVWKKAQR